jgi:NDP-sugar pyrophosphorylase family protein
MILAAGLGTRLRPLTNDRPKALVVLNGRTLLEITIERLRQLGIREIIINVHHHAEMIVEYLRAHDNFGLRIEISRESELLDTGGGLKQAAWFFLESSAAQEPFLLHNVDVISNIDLARILNFHQAHGALAALAVQRRATSRPLLFDQANQLRGRAPGRITEGESAGEAPGLHARAFSGIHVIAPRIFALMTESGAFSIIDVYVRLAVQGERILAFDANAYAWRDLGRPDHLLQAAQEMQRGDYES